MKTTVDLADDLLLRAKREAEASHTTLRSLIEEGLREVLGRKALSKQKPIKPVTFRGRGLQPAFGVPPALRLAKWLHLVTMLVLACLPLAADLRW
jgi:hypothetical protein